jgi:uncharacterized protein YraI
MISRKTTISAAALLIASAGAAAAFPATATSDLNVRSGPGTGYSVVDRLEAGDTVEIVATQGSWYRTAEGGWANGSYLDAQGGQTGYYPAQPAYDYGPAAFYYGSNPYYYDDAGYYFYIDGGRRHQVGWDWFRDRNHRDFRWSNDRFRRDFEGRRGNWDRDRSANRNWDGQRGNGQWRDGQRGDGQRNANQGWDGQRGDGQRGEGQRWQRGDGGVSAGANVNIQQPQEQEQLRSGRASAERSGGADMNRGEGVRDRGAGQGGRRQMGDQGPGPWRPGNGGGN